MLACSFARAVRGVARPRAGVGPVAQLSSASSSVESIVLRLCEEHGGSASPEALLDDLTLKFKVLSACELAFGAVIRSTELTDVKTVEDAIDFFEDKEYERGQKLVEAEAHWSKHLPPNVVLDETGSVGLEGEYVRKNPIKARRPNDIMGLR